MRDSFFLKYFYGLKDKNPGIFPNRTLREAGMGGPAARPYAVAIECLIQPS